MAAQVHSFQAHPTTATEVKSTRKYAVPCQIGRGGWASACVLTIPAHGLHRTTHLCTQCPVSGQLSVPILPTSALWLHPPALRYSIPKPVTSSPPLQHWIASLGKIVLLLYKNDEDMERKIKLLTLGSIELTSSTQGA